MDLYLLLRTNVVFLIIIIFYESSNYMNGLYIPESNALRFNINYNKIEIQIKINTKKF